MYDTFFPTNFSITIIFLHHTTYTNKQTHLSSLFIIIINLSVTLSSCYTLLMESYTTLLSVSQLGTPQQHRLQLYYTIDNIKKRCFI